MSDPPGEEGGNYTVLGRWEGVGREEFTVEVTLELGLGGERNWAGREGRRHFRPREQHDQGVGCGGVGQWLKLNVAGRGGWQVREGARERVGLHLSGRVT